MSYADYSFWNEELQEFGYYSDDGHWHQVGGMPPKHQ